MNFKDIIAKLCNKENLGTEEAKSLMGAMMKKELTDSQSGAALIALKNKGVTAEELCSFVGVLKQFAIKINPKVKPLIDTCGTGGDRSNTFNISTTTAIVLASCGVYVAKHGNRSVSSKCGSADVLEQLGVNINIPPERIEKCIEEVGMGFLFAQAHHPAFKNIAHIRKELGIRTIFNMLGPLLNPAGVSRQIIGVYEPELTELFAETLNKSGARNAMIIHGDGLDEMTLCGKTKITQLNDGTIKTFYLEPKDVELKRCSLKEITGGSPEENANIILGILNGKKSPRKDIVLLNAAAGLMVAEKADSFKEGIRIAEDAIDNGKAMKKLEELKVFTNAA
ncbi:anthranilate phosphoribosyltransferase [Candidatus Woesearchaeota archaeon]|nr:anthranilate phosphoribosyltransferase [Candidatus Woesearchaeota archaeon]